MYWSPELGHDATEIEIGSTDDDSSLMKEVSCSGVNGVRSDEEMRSSPDGIHSFPSFSNVEDRIFENKLSLDKFLKYRQLK